MKKLSTIIKHKFKAEVNTNRFPFSYSYEEFLSDKNEHNEVSEYINLLNKYFGKDLRFEKEYFDFIIRKNSQTVNSLQHYFKKSEKAKNDYLEESYSYKVLNHFWMIFTVITNNYIVLKELLTQGKDYQAKVIFRNTIELTELCISILGNEEFYNFFKKENNVNDPEKTFQTLKYDGIKKASNKIIREIKKLPNNNFDEELWDEYQKMRDKYYDDTSKHIHSNFFNLIFNSHASLKDDEELGISDMVVHNLSGVINTNTKNNIDDIILYDSISFMILIILVIENHKLFFSKLDKKRNYLTILSVYNWELLKYRKNKN
ncbi:hypothetical protein [Flavobacterium sp. GSP14]|uniref:hypothetical protein n=1 Tax=Flavobacterium sp. GSP14 TaxID=3401734 RepID=UPI003AB0ACA8